MIKTMFAFGAFALVTVTPAAAQMASGGAMAPAGPLPRCSATVHDSCDQGANNPRAMTADQAMASGGVGDRKDDKADYMAPAMSSKPTMHKHRTMHHRTMTKHTTSTDTAPADATKPM